MQLRHVRPKPREKTPLSDEHGFLRRFLGDPKRTGAVAPSSPFLAREMARAVDPQAQGLVVELGPGTGPVTRALIARGIRRERLLLVEFDPYFCNLLAERFARSKLVRGDAYALRATLAGRLTQPVSAVVSSLPMFNEPPARRIRLLDEAFELMGPDGVFVQFTYRFEFADPARGLRRQICGALRRAHPAQSAAGERVDLSAARPRPEAGSQDHEADRPRRTARRATGRAAQGDGVDPGSAGRSDEGALEAGGGGVRADAFRPGGRPVTGLSAKERLIVALDAPSAEAAAALIARLGDSVGFYKIGMELIYGGGGLALAERLIGEGRRVFIDLKLHDIPNTVERAAAQIARLGATFLTVHAYPQTMRAALAGAGGSSLRLLAVSVLTSADDADLEEAGYAFGVRALISRRAAQAEAIGLAGLVASAADVAALRAEGCKLTLVCPGVRPAGDDVGDQKRVATPGQAIADGADYLVVGRPITAAVEPRAVAEAIVAEIARHGSSSLSQ